MWAVTYINELVRTDADEAWQLLLLLTTAAEEEHPAVLKDIDIHVFDQIVELHGETMSDRILAAAKDRAAIQDWLTGRRGYGYVSDSWRKLLLRFTESG